MRGTDAFVDSLEASFLVLGSCCRLRRNRMEFEHARISIRPRQHQLLAVAICLEWKSSMRPCDRHTRNDVMVPIGVLR